MNFLNLFVTKDNSLILLFRIYYSIALLFVLTILTSLIFSQNVYDKQIKILYPNNNSTNENFDQTLDKLYAAKLTEEIYISKKVNLLLRSSWISRSGHCIINVIIVLLSCIRIYSLLANGFLTTTGNDALAHHAVHPHVIFFILEFNFI